MRDGHMEKKDKSQMEGMDGERRARKREREREREERGRERKTSL